MGKNADKLLFGPFCLDRTEGRLLVWADQYKPVPLTPKALDLLLYLASRTGKLVTKEELLSAVWSDVIVGDGSIKVAVREVRKALADDAETPKYIETVHRRGYRFVADVTPEATEPPQPPPPLASSRQTTDHTPRLVGRDDELGRLVQTLARASSGRRQCVLVTGSAGSGKSALVEAFLARVQSGKDEIDPPLLLTGHCFEQFGVGQPYLPVWEAIGRAKHEAKPLGTLLARHDAELSDPSPTDSVVTVDRRRVLSQRLLRDLAEAIEGLAAHRPVVFVLEDAHWVDHSTLDLLSMLARRRASAQLMLLITYRPADADEHPLREVVRELLASRLAEEMPLEPLGEAAVAQYVAARVNHGSRPAEFARRLHRRTGGHPLFLVHVVEDITDNGALKENWQDLLDRQVPATVRATIEAQLESLSDPEQRVLEACAISGVEFSSASAAAALEETDIVRIERVCDDLARQHRFLAPAGLAEWPDGTAATRFRFVHELYHNVVVQRLGHARRAQLHRALGRRLESACGDRAPAESASLAMHFELGRDWLAAVKYLRLAADAALRQYAHRETVAALRRAVALLDRLDGRERIAVELPLLASLGVNLQILQGCAAPEVEQIFARAEALCAMAEHADDVERLFPVLWGVWVFHKVRSELPRAEELAIRLLGVARVANDPSLLMQAHQAMCVTSLCQGHFAITRDHMEQARSIYDPKRDAGNARRFGQDPGVATLAFGAVALALLGEADRAVKSIGQAMELAQRLAQPSSRAIAVHFAAMLHQLLGDASTVAKLARSELKLAEEQGFQFWRAGAIVLGGWAAAMQGRAGGIDEIRQGLSDWRATGSRTYEPYYLGLLGEALLRHNRIDEASAEVDKAILLAATLHEGLYSDRLARLKSAIAAGITPA